MIIIKPSIKNKNGKEFFISDSAIITTALEKIEVKIISFHADTLSYSLIHNEKIGYGHVSYDCILDIEPFVTSKDPVMEMINVYHTCSKSSTCGSCKYLGSNNPICAILDFDVGLITEIKRMINPIKNYMEGKDA